MADVRKYLVAGERETSGKTLEASSPYDGSLVAEVAAPSEADVEAAVQAAADCAEEARKLPTHARAEALMHISRRLDERVGEVGEVIAREGGKPLKWANVEAARAVSTFRWAAEECRRFEGEIMRLDTDASLGSRAALIRRFPLGPVLAISPFNFPVNLVAHKMAPDLPAGMCSVLPIGGSRAGELAKDERFKKISFTGSSQVGWELKAADPRKAVTLELGGNAGVIVHDDADLDRAAQRVAFGGYYQAGQSCISVQRVFAQDGILEEFQDKLVAEVGKLRTGDPMDPEVDVGPVIDHDSLEKISSWVDEAVQSGAEILIGGKREDPFYAPPVLSKTSARMKVRQQEIFGPVVTLEGYSSFDEALALANETDYGLQAGVFTRDVGRIMLAHRDLEVGGVIVNDVSSFRADQMPYGGSKDSGSGREGLRFAMDEMTERRVLVLSEVPL